jgi:predicted DNA-binding ribbon-helix-helix protein
MLGYGDIMFMTPGEGRNFVVFGGVKDSVKLKTTFFDLLKKIKERSRLVELLRELEKECGFGRLPEERYAALRQKYGS